ncbi:hypothetical protein QEH59_17950 [Coraliomargarita sp. SDUM461004]|uniref:Sel1 repeat family protein n=1 Tax=Thalassobacterium sedimentorum TaxID=3041258 RepID=A0ABU1ANR7_9BACT|nr:hypothetical protein [Coraliomargarita sp. SDUM461004]MDQ8196324.1 hypothetical protein [Coraliomargarita sp. SDUM461004]
MKRLLHSIAACLAFVDTLSTALNAKTYQADDFNLSYNENEPDAGGVFFYKEIQPADGVAPISIPLNSINGQPELQEFIYLPDLNILLIAYDAGTIGSSMQVAVTHLAVYDLKSKNTLYNDQIATNTIEDYTAELYRYRMRRIYLDALQSEAYALGRLAAYAEDSGQNDYAHYLLGEYWRGSDGPTAFKHYSAALEAGSAPAAFALAEYFYSERAQDTGVPTDPHKALELYKIAAEKGHIDSCLRVAEYYEQNPAAAEADQASAFAWYDEAAEAGSAQAMQKLKALARK